ncbi:hypothetical protein BDF21DRAFT_402746 [Thamnidium elegans]|nr:hypothetical protein BDF21DRAFT_402746 [Thamnidium elegans]
MDYVVIKGFATLNDKILPIEYLLEALKIKKKKCIFYGIPADNRKARFICRNYTKTLAKSIDKITAMLATRRQTIRKCPPTTMGLSLIIPGFNVSSAEAKQYVMDRMLDLSQSSTLAGYIFTPKEHTEPLYCILDDHVNRFNPTINL